MRSLWRETLITLLLIAVGALVGYLLVTSGSRLVSTASSPPSWRSGRDFSATTEHLRDTLYDGGGGDDPLGSSPPSCSPTTPRSRCSASRSASPSACRRSCCLIYQRAPCSARFFALYGSRGLGFELGGWLSIHGTTEIFAIILAGAAGLRIGWSVVFPGDRTRLAAAATSGRTAALAMVGVVLMLLCAGLLEGFGRQLIIDDWQRYTIGGILLVFWCAYFYLPRRGRARAWLTGPCATGPSRPIGGR